MQEHQQLLCTEELERNIILGQVDLEIIKQVKENVSIPVIGNGDIKTTSDAKKMFEYTNVDGIMIGRATLGTPWIIGQIIDELSGKEKQEISNQNRLDTIKEHLKIAVDEKGEYIAIREMRKHICGYIKNMKESSKFREKVNRIEDINELISCLNEYFNSI